MAKKSAAKTAPEPTPTQAGPTMANHGVKATPDAQAAPVVDPGTTLGARQTDQPVHDPGSTLDS